MKYLLIIFLTLFSFIGFSQSRTKIVRDSVDVLVPLGMQLKPSDLRKVLKQIIELKEIIGFEPVVNPNANFIDKGQRYELPWDGFGRYKTVNQFKHVALKNATTYETQIADNVLMNNPQTVVSNSTNYTLTLDTNKVYYTRHRGKNASFSGAWSDVKKFDTYSYPAWDRINSLFDITEYDPVGNETYWRNEMSPNKEYLFFGRIADKTLFSKFLKTEITNFPYIVQTGLGTLVKTVGTLCKVEYAWGKSPDEIDVAPYLSFSNGNMTLALPNSTFPILKISFHANILYLKP